MSAIIKGKKTKLQIEDDDLVQDTNLDDSFYTNLEALQSLQLDSSVNETNILSKVLKSKNLIADEIDGRTEESGPTIKAAVEEMIKDNNRNKQNSVLSESKEQTSSSDTLTLLHKIHGSKALAYLAGRTKRGRYNSSKYSSTVSAFQKPKIETISSKKEVLEEEQEKDEDVKERGGDVQG